VGVFGFFSARRRAAAGDDHVSLLVSRSAARGYVQIIRIGPGAQPGPEAGPESGPQAGLGTEPVARAGAAALPGAGGDPGPLLLSQGHAVLADLSFATGSARLTGDSFASLAALAGWLAANPEARVVLVGHTDASGALAGNIALSRDRAQTVRRLLIDRLGVRPEQVSAEGVGPLAPVASNLTEAGRQQNRRVEAVLTSTLPVTP
jgi:OOP family OmpA-OmpF porin